MSYGIIEYNDDGLPICEICSKPFKRVLAHVRQKHELTERQYKKLYGFDLTRGICSKDSAELSRTATLNNYDRCITRNLSDKGKATQFKKGSRGRTKEQVSEQTRLMLKERLKEPKMVEAMRESGRKVGLTGLGNKKKYN